MKKERESKAVLYTNYLPNCFEYKPCSQGLICLEGIVEFKNHKPIYHITHRIE